MNLQQCVAAVEKGKSVIYHPLRDKNNIGGMREAEGEKLLRFVGVGSSGLLSCLQWAVSPLCGSCRLCLARKRLAGWQAVAEP